MEDRVIIIRKKLETFLRNKYNLMFVGIILFAFIIRLYYFFQTYNQPLWWDEAEYFSITKSILSIAPYDYPVQRPILFPLIMAFFYIFTHSEAFVRFMVVLLPSMGCVVMTYLVGKELYNKKVGLISSFIMSVFWVLMFNTFRVHTDALALFFGLLAIYFFWKGYVEKKSTKLLFLAAIFIALAFLVRVFYLIIIPIFLIFLLITERLNFLKEKKIWYAALSSLILVVPYLIWSFIKFGDPLAFLYGYITPDALSVHATRAIPWMLIWDVLKIYMHWVYLVLFFFGLLTLIDLVLGFDLVLKNKRKVLKSDLFIVINILAVVFFFMFVFRVMGEPRWLIFMAPALFFIIAKGLVKIYHLLSKYHKVLALIVILLLLFSGAFQEIKYGDSIINAKKSSYLELKEAGLWIKHNSLDGGVIFTKSVPQITYYAERESVGIQSIEEEFEKEIRELKPKYMILSVFEVHSETMLNYPQQYPNILKPVQAYFADSEQTQPLLVIYEFTGYEFENSTL
ncbi:MAG: glycosyltransferase family 39 protein [Nanoarchaeota archaeon]|nr:glycosyltransferase family 39 protein [Nanoarchaeota archaeon]